MEVTLDELLLSRDNRHQRHLELLEQYPEGTLVSVTMVMPGPVKSNPISMALADKAEAFLQQNQFLQITFLERRDLHTGSEIYFVSRLPLLEVKRLCCLIEDRYPLGRLWDFDVIQPDSTPMSRTEIGEQPRRCIICDDEPSINCIRARRHSKPDLYARVELLFNQYKDTPVKYDLGI